LKLTEVGGTKETTFVFVEQFNFVSS